MKTGRVGLGLLPAALALLLAPGLRAPADEKPAAEARIAEARERLVGEWRLNRELSEDPREKLRQAREAGRSGGGPPGMGGGPASGWPGGGRGGHHRGGYGGGGRGPEGGGEDGGGRALAMPLRASDITITNLQPQVTMLEPDGLERRIRVDGAAHRDGEGNEVKAHWDGDELVVETKAERGRTKETWSVAGDPRRLTVRLEVKGPYGTVKVKRVFDPRDHAAQTP